MSFENWNRFVAETIRRLNDDKETKKQGGRAAAADPDGREPGNYTRCTKQEVQTMEISRDTERRWQEKLDAMRADGDEPRQMTAAEAVKEYVRDFGTPSGSAEPTQEDIETILFQ